MHNMTEIQKKVEEAMESLADIKRASPDPFLFTRLQARISREDSSIWERMTRLVSRPAIAFMTVSLVLILDVAVAVNENSAPLTTQQDLAEIATADDLGTNAFYDIENVQP